MRRVAFLGPRGTFTEQAARKLLGEILERVTGEPLQNYKIRQWFEHWLQLKEKVRSEKTMSRYRQVVRDFLNSIGPRADFGLTHLSSKDVLTYRDSLRAKKRTERTANLSVKVISAALNTACRQQHIASNPALAVEHLKVREAEKGVFAHEQVGKLLANAQGDWRRAILFAYYTGARLSDIAKMQWESIDLEEKLITFTPTKTGKPLRLPLHSDLQRELLKRPGIAKAYLFPSLAAVKSTGGAPWTQRPISRHHGKGGHQRCHQTTRGRVACRFVVRLSQSAPHICQCACQPRSE